MDGPPPNVPLYSVVAPAPDEQWAQQQVNQVRQRQAQTQAEIDAEIRRQAEQTSQGR